MRAVAPFGDRVVAQVLKPAEQTVGGIILTSSSVQATEAVVLSSGLEMLTEGDVIVFIPDAGYAITVDGEQYIILGEKEILAVLHHG